MLLTKIPHFKEVMVVSFECDHCGARSVWLIFAALGSADQKTYHHIPVVISM